jgi:hypothetical protein
MTVDEMELVSRLKDAEPLTPETFEQARTLLRVAMAVYGSPGPRPIESRRHVRRRTVALRSTVGAGIAAAAIAVALVVTSTGRAPSIVTPPVVSPPSHSGVVHAPLVRLADAIIANNAPLPGDATLILRTTNLSNGQSWTGADLYTDSGEYFYAPTEGGLQPRSRQRTTRAALNPPVRWPQRSTR